MVAGAEEGLDPLAEDQVSLEPSEPQEKPQPDPVAQFKALLESQQQTYERRIRGLESKLDRALNSVRRTSEEQVRRAHDQQLLEQIPEEHREWAAALIGRVAGSTSAPGRAAATETPQAAPASSEGPATGQTDEAWQAVYDFVEDYGVDPKNSAIEYSLLLDPTVPERERRQRFMASLRRVAAGDVGAKPTEPQAAEPTGARPAPRPRQAVAPSPPVEGAPSVRGLRTEHDLEDAFFTGRITREEFQKQMASIGKPLR